MKLLRAIKICLAGFIVLTAMDIVCAGSMLVDPGIPDGEAITYVSRAGNVSTTIVERVAIKKEGEKEIYEITSESGLESKKVKLEKDTMSVLYASTERKFPEATVDSELRIIYEKPPCEKDEIKLADFSSLLYVLRGFPFGGKIKTLKINSFGENKKSYMGVKFIKTEKIKVKCGTINCYRLELGMEGLWAGFLPKISLWYSVEAPHYLVRYEGIDGPPGSPKRVVELRDRK